MRPGAGIRTAGWPVVRFVRVESADPTRLLAVATEMAGQVASFVFSAGAAVQVHAPARRVAE